MNLKFCLTNRKYTYGFLLIEALIYIFLFSLIITSSITVFYYLIENNKYISDEAFVFDEAEFVLAKINWVLRQNIDIIKPDIGLESSELVVSGKDLLINNTFKLINGQIILVNSAEGNFLSSSKINILKLKFENQLISENQSISILRASFWIGDTEFSTSKLIYR